MCLPQLKGMSHSMSNIDSREKSNCSSGSSQSMTSSNKLLSKGYKGGDGDNNRE